MKQTVGRFFLALALLAVMTTSSWAACTAACSSGPGGASCGSGCACGCAAINTASSEPASRAVNISTRARIETGDNVLIAGFIISGNAPKRVIVRAVGPSLPVPGAVADPMLDLHSASALLASNDNWRSAQQSEIIATNLPPAHDREAAVVRTVDPGAYTVVVRGANGGTGIGLVEVYDLDAGSTPVRLGNISTRGRVSTGDNVMIGGFIVRDGGSKRVILRARGPTLTLNESYLPDRLLNPEVTLHNSVGSVIAQNDNWRSTQEADIHASALAPTSDNEPAIIASLAPGAYTFIVRGVGGTSGLALVELYDLDQSPQADGSTFYLATLRGQSGAITGGSGTSSLRLSADETSAILAFDYTNLSTPVISIHVHAADGTILFDPDEVTPQADGSFLWIIEAVANFSIANILQLIKTGGTYLNIHTSNYPAGEIKGFFNYASGAPTAPVPTPPPALPGGPPTATDAARFLDQSTFGPTAAEIARLQNARFDSFLNEQFNAPPTYLLPYVDASGVTPPGFAQVQEAFWNRAIAAPDQLRQRVAFALSEILVVSAESAGLGQEGVGLAVYYDVLTRNAFGNFRNLLEDVTLNPAMGRFLDMLRNQKADPARNRIPNENFAREILQLFSIGLYRLHLDGSLILGASGLPLETYGQEAVLGLSEVFTGWTWGQPEPASFFGVPANYRDPMVNVFNRHETAAKTILDGVVLPANQTAAQDLDQALDTIFKHPNVGPFICQQLIQRLVTSNPSPGYLHRVSSIFNNNGQGVRGDLRAVVRAILTDYDARGAIRTQQGYGHLREPVMRLTGLLRAFQASTPTGKFNITGVSNLGQLPLRAPTVFNFFSPDYQAPGPISAAHLKSPEFQITTETTVVTIPNYLRTAINTGLGPADNRTTLNLSQELAIAGNAEQLVDHLNRLLMASTMTPEMRGIMVATLNRIPASNPTERVRTAIYLVVASPEYVIQK